MMPSVMYHTKSNNQDIKKLMDNPTYGRELVRKLASNETRVVKKTMEDGTIVETHYIQLSEGRVEPIFVKVKELVYTK